MSFSALDSALSGPLFAPQSMRDLWSDRAQLAAMLKVEWALALAQASQGLCPLTVSEAIATLSVDDFDLAALGTETALAGVPTIPFVKALRKKVPAECEPFVHKGATTQDILDSALMVQAQQSMELLLPMAQDVLSGLSQLTSQHALTACVGRSYGQHAVPVSFGYKVAIWMTGLCDVLATWPVLSPAILKASLAGPVGTLSGKSSAHHRTGPEFARLLGLHHDPVPWHVRRHPVVALAGFLTQLLGALAKMAEDIVHLASTEVGEVNEPFMAGRGGSSAMPHKRNPVASTIIIAAFQASLGLQQIVQAGMAASHERPAGAWHGEWHALPQLFGLAAGALLEAKRLAQGLEVNAERMRFNLDQTRGLIYADAVAARLAAELGAGKAHHLIEQAAEIVRHSGTSLYEVINAGSDWPSALQGERLKALFDPAPAVEAASQIVPAARAQAMQVMAALTRKG